MCPHYLSKGAGQVRVVIRRWLIEISWVYAMRVTPINNHYSRIAKMRIIDSNMDMF
jgi:hypothetical protein